MWNRLDCITAYVCFKPKQSTCPGGLVSLLLHSPPFGFFGLHFPAERGVITFQMGMMQDNIHSCTIYHQNDWGLCLALSKRCVGGLRYIPISLTNTWPNVPKIGLLTSADEHNGYSWIHLGFWDHKCHLSNDKTEVVLDLFFRTLLK